MSQKPSSVDPRISDFKRVPGFNYVLSVLTEDEHTHNSLCSDIREAWSINASNGLQIYAFPEGTKDESATLSTRRGCFRASCPPRARQRAKRKFQRRAVRRGLSGHNTVDPGRPSRAHNSHNTHNMLWAAVPREP